MKPPTAVRTPAEWEDAVLHRLPVLALACSVIVVGQALMDLAQFGGAQRVMLAGTEAVMILVLWALAAAAKRGRMTMRLWEPVVAILLIFVAADVALRIVFTQEPWHAIWLAVCVVGVGVAVDHRNWFLASLAASWVAWIVALLATLRFDAQPVDPAIWGEIAGALATASVMAVGYRTNRMHTVEGLVRVREDLERQLVTDALTGLGNRRAMHLLAPALLDVARRASVPVHCLFIDVDAFKKVNDTYGHEFGDSVLVAVAEALQGATRASDLVVRWAGDEFVLLGLGSGVAPEALAQRVRSRLDAVRPALSDGWTGTVTVGGVVSAVGEGQRVEDLLHRADLDMYRRRGERRSGASSAGMLLD